MCDWHTSRQQLALFQIFSIPATKKLQENQSLSEQIVITNTMPPDLLELNEVQT